MSNSSKFIDVHTFDGRWSHDVTTRVPLNDKCIMFNWLIKILENNKNILRSSSLDGLKLIVSNTQKQPNYDPSNKIYADDILAEICIILSKIKEEDRLDILKNIAEQMDDMYKLGQCPQGRSTRLIQVYKSLKEC